MRVWAKNEAMRAVLKHPIAGGFHPDLYAPAEWPDDQFTSRRLRDGDVLLEPPKEVEQDARVRKAGTPEVKTEKK